MHNWVKVALSATAVVFIAGTAAASASPTAHNLRQPANPRPQAVRPAALVDTTVESN